MVVLLQKSRFVTHIKDRVHIANDECTVFVIHEVVLHLHCRPKVKYLLSLIVIVLTGRGPRSPGSIEFLFLI